MIKNLKYPLLYSPLKVGTLTWRNRIQSAPMSMTEMDAKEGLTDEAIAFYGRLAKGGAAVVTVGESIVRSDCGKTHPQMLMLGRDEVLPYLVAVTDAIHEYGAYADIEISHGGVMADPKYNDGKLSIGPMGYVDEWGDEIIAMDRAMMDDVAEAFAEAAATAKACGFDMVMIHAGHGWLLHQFLSPKYNRRTDEYGGSLENRARFPLEVVRRVRERVGCDFVLDMRVSGDEFTEGGSTIADAINFVKLAEPYINLVNVSAGAPVTRHMIPGAFDKPGFNTPFAVELKKHVSIPVTTVGGYTQPSMMEGLLEKGEVDGFIIGHGLLADPDIPRKGREGRQEDILTCLRCNSCFQIKYSTRAFKCAINPMLGRWSKQPEPQRTCTPKRVLVAGGGPGGLEAAYVAAGRGHSVVLCEKTGRLGGALKFAEHVSFKYELKLLIDQLTRRCEQNGVEIRLNTPVTPALIEELAPDALICAIGAQPIVPPIPGIRGAKVVIGKDMYDEGVKLGERVVVIGGGLVGSESALELAWKGKTVTLVEMAAEIAADATPNHKRSLREFLGECVDIRTSTTCVEVNERGVVVKGPDGACEELPADTVVLAAGLKARRSETDALRDCIVDFHEVGDCMKARKIMDAVRSGFDAGAHV